MALDLEVVSWMRSCKNCTFPHKFARFFDWRSDGTIISTDRTRMKTQITFLESGEFEALFDSLSDRIGMSTDRFLIKAQKAIGKVIFASLPIRHVRRVPANRFFRPQAFARLMVRLIAPYIAALGDGRLSLVSYRAGDSLFLRFRKPCVNPLLVGSSVGIYESVEEMPSSEVDYWVEDGDLLIRIARSDSPPETDQEMRLYLEEVVPGKGPVEYARCPVCGEPLLAAESLSWDLKEGIIWNKLTGKREVVVSVQSVNAILRELENELGEEVLTFLYDAQKAIDAKRLKSERLGGGESFWKKQLESFAIRGLGYPLVFETSDSAISVKIGNAYNQVLYAAKLAAALEALTGKPSSIEWKVRNRDHGSYRIEAGTG